MQRDSSKSGGLVGGRRLAMALLAWMGVAATTGLAVDSRIGVGALPGSSSIHGLDLNADGVFTDSDLVLYVHSHMGEGPDEDWDGDGQVTAADTIEGVGRLLRATVGDVNGDSELDELDLADLVQAMQEASYMADKDANADGLIDASDFVFVYDQVMEGRMRIVWETGVVHLATYLHEAREYGVEVLLSGKADTRQHHMFTSESWPLGPNGHKTTRSHKMWPPSHGKEVSRTWPDDEDDPEVDPYRAHAVDHSKSFWPANHWVEVSVDWWAPPSWPTRRHLVGVSDYTDHSQAESEAWRPQYHNEQWSNAWRYSPCHVRTRSNSWPSSHVERVSWRWPPNHGGLHSTQMPTVTPSEHVGQISSTWCISPPQSPTDNCWMREGEGVLLHGRFRSVAWPPGHWYQTSLGWISHERARSVLWPPNHDGGVSLTWPNNIAPSQFPPNHMFLVSTELGEPTLIPRGPGEWPAWPPNHNWFHTIKEIIEIPAGILPLIPLAESGQ